MTTYSKNLKFHFAKFFMNYLILILIICLSFIPIYYTALNSMKKTTSKDLTNVLNNQLLVVNNQLSSLENISVSLRNNSSFRLLAQITPDKFALPHYFLLQNAQTYMRAILSYPSLIKDAFFLFEKNDLLISNNLLSDDFSKEYHFASYFEGLSYEGYRDMLNFSAKPYFIKPVTLVTNEINSFPIKTFVLPYVIPTCNTMSYNYDSALVCFIDISLLHDFLLANTQYSFIQITTDDDVLLHSFSQNMDFNPADLTIVETTLVNSPLKLIVGLDQSILLKPLKRTIFLIQFFFAVSIIISIALSLLLYHKSTKPLKKLLKFLTPFSDDIMSDDIIKEETIFDAAIFTINNLSEQKKIYISKINMLKTSIKTNLFDKLIHGHLDLIDLDMLEDQLPFLANPFILIIINFSLRNSDSTSFLLSEQELSVLTSSIISQELNNVQYIHDVLSKQSILILSTNQSLNQETLCINLTKISEIIAQQLNYSCFFSISEIGHSYKDVLSCYEQTLSIVRLHYPIQKSNILFYAPSPYDDKYIELKDTQKLYEFIISGQFYEIESMLNILQQRLLNQHSVTNETLARIYHSLQNAIIFAAKDLKVESDYVVIFQEYSKYVNVTSLFNSLKASCSTLCELIHQNKKTKSTKILVDFKYLVDSEYTNPNLSITSISEQLNLSEKYLCTYIKDHLGKSIGDYIEEKRMEQAKLLLTDNKLIIKDISASVGFNSQNTFYKAFKRYTGVSPGTWRDAHITH